MQECQCKNQNMVEKIIENEINIVGQLPEGGPAKPYFFMP